MSNQKIRETKKVFTLRMHYFVRRLVDIIRVHRNFICLLVIICAVVTWRTRSGVVVVLTTAPKAIKNTPKKQCLISSKGSDGIGHQMEAKLSCIAAAAALDDVTYVHSPMATNEHGVLFEDKVFRSIEDMFGLTSSHFEILNHQVVSRDPLPWVGKCNEASWFDNRPSSCSRKVAYVNDNCWDFFYCSIQRNEDHVVKPMVYALQELYRNSNDQRRDDDDDNLTIAVHIRGTDAGKRKMRMGYYEEIIQQLCLVAPEARVIVHTDDTSIRDRIKDLPSHVIVHDPSSTTILQVLQDLMHSDLLVGSISSLSYAAGLYNLGRPVLSPYDHSRIGLANLPGIHLIAKDGNKSQSFYKSVIVEAKEWKKKSTSLKKK